MNKEISTINPESDLAELRDLKKILIDISGQVYRDLRFFYQSENKQQRREIMNGTVDIESNKIYGVLCRTLCKVVKKAGENANLNLDLITCDTDEFGHVDLLLTTKNGNRYIINCLSDLERIQIGMKTKRFASEEYYNERYKGLLTNISFLSDEENLEIDKDIGYFQLMYTDEFIDVLKGEFINFIEILNNDVDLRNFILGNGSTKEDVDKLSPEQITDLKLKFLLDFCNKRKGIIGHIELVRIYKLLSKQLFSKEERKLIRGYDCFLDKKSDTPLPNEKIWNVDEDRVRFLKLTVGDSIYLLTTSDDTYKKMSRGEYEQFFDKYNVHENELANSVGVITEAIRNKGVGVNLLKHMVLKRKLKKLDEEASKLSQNEIDTILLQIEQTDKNEEICFTVNNDSYAIKLEEISITVSVNGKESKYNYENDNLVEITAEKKITYKWIDEGRYLLEEAPPDNDNMEIG